MATPKWTPPSAAQLLLVGYSLLLAACGGNQETLTPTTAATVPVVVATAAPAVIELELPPTPDDETPLQSILSNVPPAIVVKRTLLQSELAASLHTTVEQLQYANPDLTDPVLEGKLIVVPSGYRVLGKETLAEIAAITGIAEAELRKSNGLGSDNTPLAAGTTIQFPSQYVVQKDIALADLAALLGVASEQLSATNPYLLQDDIVAANTLIVLPAVSNGQ